MKLTPHFTLSEFTRSRKAEELGLDNTPGEEALRHLQATAEMMERIRAVLGVPITITSGFRSRALNRAVGGEATSHHLTGHAADFIAPAYGTPYQVAKALAPLVRSLDIGQLINEGVAGKRWVHVGTRIPARPVNRVISIGDAGTLVGIQEVA